MDLSSIVRNNSEYNKKYEYYTSLGYSEKAALVLSVFTYGGVELKKLIEDLGNDRILERLYDWVLESNGKDPMSEVRSYYAEKHRATILEDPFVGSGPGNGAGGFFGGLLGGAFGSKKSAPRGLAGGARGMGAVRDSMAMGAAAPMIEEPAVERGSLPAPEPVVTPMSAKELAEAVSTDSYETIEEKDEQSPVTAPTSTFRMTSNTASTGIVINQIRQGRNVNMDQVRIEELLNYFDYDEAAPGEETFAINTQLCNVGEDRQLLYVYAGAGGEVKDYQNIVLLLDVSGSMSSRAELTQEIVATVVSKLKKNDRFSLITYSSEDETVYEGLEIKGDGDKEDVMGRLLSIRITGCTNGSAGIETAYKIGAEHYEKDGNNQVILITDGDLNFGITAKGGLKDLITEKKKTGLFLSVLGCGLYNFKDDKLEVLSKNGNGTYRVVNDLEDVKYSVRDRYVSLTNIVAKDVKAQVEFNPRYVKSYRLLGYENRKLNHEDFINDNVISEPYGAGGHGVALYEIRRGGAEGTQELKYQTAVLTDSEELCTVKVRFKQPLSDESVEISKAVDTGAEAELGGNTRLAYFIYCLGEKLRGSDKLKKEDEEFYAAMLKDGEYLKLPGGNSETLKLIAEYLS